MTGFHEVRFPDRIAVGSRGGPAFSTTVVETASGHEQRHVNWSQARGRWDVGTGLRRRDDLDELIAFFRARMGRAYGFRFKDHADYRALAQPIGVGDGTTTTFQLVKRYTSGPATVTRTIAKPVQGTVEVYRNAQLQSSGVSVDHATGVVTFSGPPEPGDVLTADFELDVPVRFDVDEMELLAATRIHHEWPRIRVVELRT